MESTTVDGKAMIAALDEFDTAWKKLASLPVHGLGAAEALTVLERLETCRRRQPAVEHALLAHLQSQATAAEVGAKAWPVVLAARLGIGGSTPAADWSRRASWGPERRWPGRSWNPNCPLRRRRRPAGRSAPSTSR